MFGIFPLFVEFAQILMKPKGIHITLVFPCLPPCRFSVYSEYLSILACFGAFHSTPVVLLAQAFPQKQYLDRNPDKSEVFQSLLPTILVSLVSLLIPPILLLIAKKMHLITTISARDDILMTRYYKFLIVNVLIFFCVGTAAMQSLLQSFGSPTDRKDVLQIIADSFPTAGPFYVGWRRFPLLLKPKINGDSCPLLPVIFSTALHGGFELCLCKPLLMSNSVTC